jgi:membrane-associated phospholipid phosphatase
VDRRLAAAAGIVLAAFVAFSAWRFASGGHSVDVTSRQFTGWLLHGTLDVIVSAMWPLGEPQLGAIVAAFLAAEMLIRRRRRTAVLVVACFAALTVIELGMRGTEGLASHATSLRSALVHAYPSGHTARIPLLGTMIALLVGGRWRWALLGLTALLTVMEAIDRIDSTIQLGSDVVGGVLLGIVAAFTFAALLRRWDR